MTSKAEQMTVAEARAMLRVAVDMVFDAGLFAEQARDKTDEDEAYVAVGKAADALIAAAKREAFGEAQAKCLAYRKDLAESLCPGDEHGESHPKCWGITGCIDRIRALAAAVKP